MYVPLMGWHTYFDNERYIVANNTLNFLYFDNFMNPFLIPTPINLTLVAEAIYLNNYSIVGNTIIENSEGYVEEYTFNDDGFLTSFVSILEGEIEVKFVLCNGGGAVPFGSLFLVFTVISVIALVYLKKHKIS